MAPTLPVIGSAYNSPLSAARDTARVVCIVRCTPGGLGVR